MTQKKTPSDFSEGARVDGLTYRPADEHPWALYGATGYTGVLIAEQAVERGHRPLLMGRSAEKLAVLAARLKLDFRAVKLDDPAALRSAISGLKGVLHASGPFIHTAAPMVEACLAEGVSYLDITGEPDVLKASYARDAEAMARGVALISGVGFDVVASNCLVAHVAGRVKKPRTLAFAIAGLGRPSAGTVKSAVPVVLSGGRVYRGGREVRWPLGRGIRRIRFSTREAWGAPGPIGDLDAAFRATGIGDITAYVAVPSRLATLGRIGWPLGQLALPLLKAALGSGALDRVIERRVPGGTAQSRAQGRCYLWALAEGEGERAEAWLETSEGYVFTADAAVRCVEKLLARPAVGALAPSQAFGADLVLELPGCARFDSPPLGTAT